MSQELHYTSAPRGLWPGSQGYCTVACTANMPRSVAERLEGLSAYRNIFPPHDPRVAENPVVFSHLRVSIGGAPRHVLSRIGFAGLDYSERANKYAHHVVLGPSELPRGGPAWLLSQPGFVSTSWNGRVGWIETPHPVPRGDISPRPCAAWAQTAGDAGWAGVLADAFLAGAKPVAYLIHEPGQDILPLVLEAQALLPPERRWDLTFSTYVTTLPQGVVCAWRGVVRGTPEEAQARRAAQALVLDLTRPLATAADGPLVTQARTGRPAPSRVAVEAPPPLLPAGLAPGAREPVVLQPVVGASAYSVVPELPQPPAALSPERERQWSGTSWPRRARAIVAAVCVLLLIAGGLGGGLFFTRYRARNANRLAQRETTRELHPAQGEDQSQRPTSPREKHGDGGNAKNSSTTANSLKEGRQSGDPAGQSGNRAEPEPRGRPSFLPTADKPGGTEGVGAISTKTRKDRKDDPAASPGPEPSGNRANPAQPAPSSGRATKNNREVHRPKPTEPPRVVAEAVLPNPSESDPACEFPLPPQFQNIADLEFELLGWQAGDEYTKLKFAVERSGGPPSVLTVFSEAEGTRAKFARFTMNQGKVSFRWEVGSLNGLHMNHIDALRSCVLSVRPRAPAQTNASRCDLLLRKLIKVPSKIILEYGVKSQKIVWETAKQKPPFGRELEIHNCQATDSRVRSLKVAPGNSKRCQLFEIAGFDHLKLKVELEKQGSVKLTMLPSENEVRENVVQAILAIRNKPDPMGIPFKEKYSSPRLSKGRSLQALRTEVSLIRQTIDKMENDVRYSGKRFSAEFRQRFAEYAKIQRDAVTAIDPNMTLLNEIQGFRDDKQLKKCSIFLSIAMRIDGQLYDVAKVGKNDK